MPNRFLNNININDEYTLPSADGTVDQIITTDGAGQLSFVDQRTINAGNAEHVVIYAKNTHTAPIAKGTPVYITGTVGATDTVEIAPADAGNASHMPAVGLLDDTLAINAFGYVITGGFMDNVTTDPIDGSTPSSNDTVYVKVGGGLTLTKPTGPTGLIQNIAKVGKVSGGNSGSLIVSSILRTNDVPNLTTGKIWVGDGNTVESTVVHLDEVNERMGIGTTSPSQKLHVSGNAIVSGIGVGTTTIYSNSVNLNNSGTLRIGNAEFLAKAGNDLSIYQGKIRIQQGGNVGIGTTSPSHKLTINASNDTTALGIDFPSAHFDFSANSTSGYTSNFRINDVGMDIGHDSTARSLNLQTGNQDRLTILGNGNVGIGTTSPSYKLDVSGDAYIDETLNIESTISGTLTYGYGGVGAGNLVVGGLNFASFTPGVITLINQDTSISPGQDLGVLQFGGKDDQTNGYANGQIICTTAVGTGSGNTGGGIFRFLLSGNTSGSGPTERMRITNTGDVGIGTTSPGEKLEVNGVVKATASTDAYKGYIKQTIATIANEKGTATANYNLIPYNTLTTTTSDQYYNRMAAAYDGRIKKVYIVDTGGTTPDATVVNLKKQVNNVTSSTVYSATVTGSGSGMSAVYNFADNDFTFNAGDTFGILYQTTDSGGGARTMGGVAINIIIEYNIT